MSSREMRNRNLQRKVLNITSETGQVGQVLNRNKCNIKIKPRLILDSGFIWVLECCRKLRKLIMPFSEIWRALEK